MAAGLSIFSYQQRHDLNGKPYPGLKYSFYAADTSDPIDTYREPTLAAKHPNPVVADGYGVSPGIFIPDTVLYYLVRVTTAAGVILDDDMVVANLVPSTGEGDPPTPIEATAVFKTGDLKHRYGEGIHEGWLNCNGRSFGSSTSGADYASDDYEALFLYLWALDDGAAVVGGEGANAAADWAANKQMTLPDTKGRALVGLDDMDDDAGGVLTGMDTLGEVIGSEDYTLVAGDLPELSGTAASDGAHRHFSLVDADDVSATISASNQPTRRGAYGNDLSYQIGGSSSEPTMGRTDSTGDHTHTVTVNSGSADAISLVQPSMAVSIYIKI